MKVRNLETQKRDIVVIVIIARNMRAIFFAICVWLCKCVCVALSVSSETNVRTQDELRERETANVYCLKRIIIIELKLTHTAADCHL